MSWVALMPLRGGSKSIPMKNLQRIAGKPLYAWSLEQVLDSECFDEIVVATDSEPIRMSVKDQFGNAVTLFDRSPDTATDTASSESVMLEYLQQAEFDVLSLVQATSPLTEAHHFVEAKQEFESGKFDSLLTAVEVKRFLWTRDGVPVNYDPKTRPRRQELEGILVENGAFYFSRRQVLEQQKCRLGGKVGIYQMPEDTYLELDELEDLRAIERLLIARKINNNHSGDLKPVSVLVVDVDGTLTDAGMYYDGSGENLKKFNTRDAVGLQQLRQQGIRICIMTGETSAATEARIKKLQIEDYYPGVKDKLTLLKKLSEEWEVPLEQIAFIGDDLGDVACLQQAGVSFCPADAIVEAQTAVDYVCISKGGNGAVREVCDLLLSNICSTKSEN